MSSKPREKTRGSSPGGYSQGVRPSILIALIVLALGSVIAVITLRSGKPAADSASNRQPSVAEIGTAQSDAAQPDEVVAVKTSNELTVGHPGPAAIQRRTAPPTPAAPPRVEPSPYSRQLVNSLVSLTPESAPKTPEQVAVWKQNLAQLVQQGATGLPAIQEFLDKNMDLVFGADVARALGYGSARAAMFDAMLQIGGPEGANAMLGVLRSTADPTEIARLARNLEQLAPDQYRGEILDAAREVLAMSSGQKAADGADVAPLFDVLHKIGGAAAVSDLEQAAGKWKYYSLIALSELPDGAGVPALIQMVGDAGGPVKNIAALELLTQAAAQNPDARAALLQQVKADNISSIMWAYLLPFLSGDQMQFQNSGLADTTQAGAPGKTNVRGFHIAAGNQNFYTATPAGGLTPEQIQRQLGLIEELLAVASNPAAVQALQSSKTLLQQRQQQATGTAPRGQGRAASSGYSAAAYYTRACRWAQEILNHHA